jgi:hypothetical protein
VVETFGINVLLPGSHLSYGLLFMKPSLLRISLCPIMLFMSSIVFYMKVIWKMLISYFLTTHSPIVFGRSMLQMTFLVLILQV